MTKYIRPEVVEPKAPPSKPSETQLARVVSYRVAVKLIASAVLSLAESGEIHESDLAQLKQVARGRS